MRMKKIITFLMALLLILPDCPAYAAETESENNVNTERYYYEQLPQEAKGFYDAMYNMYERGIFKTGTDDYDLVENNNVTQEQLDGYANGNTTLLTYMGAARDAFYADYPEVFYVDFSYLSLRVTKKSGAYCAYLGAGRSDDYFVNGFSRENVEKAVEEYETSINSIVEGAKNIKAGEDENLTRKQIKYVHDEIIWNTSYRMEDTCEKENIGHIRTSYGALVKGESLCEGYSRAVKAVMNRLGIPCIIVQGGFRTTTDKIEPHMWNYVKVDDEWYAIDATADDPKSLLPSENGVDGFERADYLLAGNDVMSKRHIPDGVMSESGFEFSYPEIAGESPLFDEVADSNGLKVLYSAAGIDGETESGIFRVSYNGMGAAKTIESGKYMLMKTTNYYETTNRWEYSRWGYILPDAYMIYDTDTELILNIPNAQYVEFAITSEPPGNYNGNEGGNLENLNFKGDPLLFDTYTEVLFNPSGTYMPPPYVKTITPSVTSRLFVGKTYHIKAVYDEALRLADDDSEAGIKVYVTDKNTTAIENCKVEDFQWDGKHTIEFDFTPSKMWLDDSVTYNFSTIGLVGIESEKTPKDISYTASNKRAVCAYRSCGYYWNLFGKPELLESSDLSKKNLEEWKTEDGSSVTPEMVTGLTLVTTSPTHAQTDTMNNMIESEFPNEKVLKSETYNISLLTCNKNIVSLGDSVRLSVGFPAGYGPDDEGVTFKAYHFKKNKYGEITGVEEVPCVITRYGLVITCKSFSPFAIVALQDDIANENTTKSVVLSTTVGGNITGNDDNILMLNEGESKTLTFNAEEGYVIDKVIAGGKYLDVSDKKSMEVKIDYNDIKDGDIIEVGFVAEMVHEKEAQRGETLVQPMPVPAKADFESKEIVVKLNEKIEIVPKVTKTEGIYSYQWYKDGIALAGKTDEVLKIDAASITDSGKYSLVITRTAGAVSVESVPAECNVVVKENVTEKPETVTGLKLTLSSNDKIKLSWEKVTDADGYQVLYYNEDKKKFVKAVDVTKTSYSEGNKISGKSYRYKVRAYKKVNGKTIYGSSSKEARIIARPETPANVSGKRLSKTSVQISFGTVTNATRYQIFKYDNKSRKYFLFYKVQSKKLYKYNEKSGKWTYLNKVKVTKDGNCTINLTGLKKNDTNQRYRIKSEIAKKGYPSGVSTVSKTIRIK